MTGKKQEEIKNSHRELFVVLGMHRSGTSAITRGLQILGVDLGEKLIPPIAGNNDKGFWEDWDINMLNSEMLSVLQKDWHFLTPIQPSDVNILRKDWYVSRALEILKEKTSGSTQVFGFKDPRTTMLLPFWKEVFVQGQYRVNYIIALRHPLSVCQSLYKRDGFDIEKGLLLWLEHIISGLESTIGEQRIIVDYDRLMQAPGVELRRIAKKFNLEIIPSEQIKYEREFLDNKLRHSVYRIDDLSSKDVFSSFARKVYAGVLKAAMDEEDLDAIAFDTQIKQWHNEFSRLQPVLVLVDKLTLQLAAKDQKIQDLTTQYTEQNIELDRIKSSILWRVVMALPNFLRGILRKVRIFFVPPNSTRAQLARKVLNKFTHK